MIQYDTIKKAMGVDIAVTKRMGKAIYRWTNMYMNKSPWLNENIKSLNLPAAVSSEVARLVTMESEINITGSQRADIISENMKKFIENLPTYVEYACAAGGVVFKPYLSGTGIAIDIVRAGDFYPVSFDGAGNITAAIFPEFKRVGKKLYTRLEYQALVDGTYQIRNCAFVSNKAQVKTDDIINLGSEISLDDVPEWSDVEPYVELRNADRTLFSYFKIPLANNIDMDSPLGVSVFSRAENQIKDADEQYGATLWEFQSKETAIQAAEEFYKKTRTGDVVLPKGKERLYHNMGPGVITKEGSPFFNVYSPEIRDESFFRGYNRIVQKIEFNCGLAYGTLSDPQNVDKTAEEIKASKQRSYSTVKLVQNSLEDSLENLVGAIDAWLTIEGTAPNGKVVTSCNWDDSIVEDKETERQQDRQDVSMGVMSLAEYRAKWYNEDMETAQANLPEQNSIME